MAYSIQADILEQLTYEELVDLTDDTEQGVVDAAVVSRAVSDADEEINIYCGKIYDVPFSSVPAIIRKISVDIAIYNLYSRRGIVADVRLERYQSAVRTLEDIAHAEITLGAPLAPAHNSKQAASVSYPERLFSRDNLKNY